jgi:5'-nucleotidase
MHILVTNDDGINAPGLLALTREMTALGKVTVLAPERNWSACGHVKTLERPLRVRKVPYLEGTTAMAADGAPSDCVALSLLGVVKDKIDLVVSGINSSPNVGHDLTYSGTVTAAMEAAVWGLPGIAFSLDSQFDSQEDIDFSAAGIVARQVAAQVIQHGLPEYTLLNVNIPYLPFKDIKDVIITRQGLRVYQDKLVTREDPRRQPYYWIGGEAPTGIPEPGTDFGALGEGCVSVTPIQLDMTSYALIDTLRGWEWELKNET